MRSDHFPIKKKKNYYLVQLFTFTTELDAHDQWGQTISLVMVGVGLVQLFIFEKVERLVKTVKTCFLKKTKYLTNAYKSSSLSYKLLKMTRYI